MHCRILPFFLLLWQLDAPPPAALHGLLFRSSPERASEDQNISEPLGRRLIWWARPHTGVGRRQIEAAQPIHPVDLLQALTRSFRSSLRKPWTSPSSSITSASSDARCRHVNRERSRVPLKHYDIDTARPSKQPSIISAGLPPAMQPRPFKPLHSAGSATTTSVLFDRVLFALQFYRPNRSTLSHQGFDALGTIK